MQVHGMDMQPMLTHAADCLETWASYAPYRGYEGEGIAFPQACAMGLHSYTPYGGYDRL